MYLHLACANGDLDEATEAVPESTWEDINCGFRGACANRHLEVAKWLWAAFRPHIDVHANNEQAFRWACRFGHLKVAKWLLETVPTINTHILNDNVLRCSEPMIRKWLTCSVGMCACEIRDYKCVNMIRNKLYCRRQLFRYGGRRGGR